MNRSEEIPKLYSYTPLGGALPFISMVRSKVDDEEQYEDEFQSSANKIASSMKRSPSKDLSLIHI